VISLSLSLSLSLSPFPLSHSLIFPSNLHILHITPTSSSFHHATQGGVYILVEAVLTILVDLEEEEEME